MQKIQITSPEKILIIKPSSLGDIIHSLPFLNIIRKHFPESKIHWVVFKEFEGILQGHHMIDRLWIIDKNSWLKISLAGNTLRDIRLFFRALKKEKYDLVIDLQGLLRSGIIALSTNSPLRVGFQEAREGSKYFYTHKVHGGENIHAVDRYLKIADFIGCNISEISFPLSSAMTDLTPINFPFDYEEYAVIAPGARWKTKIWSPNKFGVLASLLPFKSVIVGTDKDIKAAEEIVKISKGKAFNLTGKTTLKELTGIISRAKFLITNDSGPMHIGAALNIYVFAIFGPTDPVRTGPYGKNNTIIRADVQCSPCFKKTCKDLKCMNDINAEYVYEKIIEKFNR